MHKLRIADSDYLVLAITAGITTVVDIESTAYAQRDPDAIEVNRWIYGERPGRARMYGVNLPVTASLMWLAYAWRREYARKPNAWIWRVPLIALGIGHAAAAVSNYLNFRSTGCADRVQETTRPRRG